MWQARTKPKSQNDPIFLSYLWEDPQRPEPKVKILQLQPGTEKREAKVVILGDFRGGVRVLFHRFQTWACGYEEI